MPAKTVLLALPNRDFDPSEVAISWQLLRAAGLRVRFATADGQAAVGDPLMLSGAGLDPWGWLPGLRRLKLLGLLLRARRAAREAYARMLMDAEFRQPLRYEQLTVADFDGLLLPGGHWARGMRAYLESQALQAFVGAFFATNKPVAAICHGVLLAARSPGADGRSALYGRKTTALTWAMEKSAWDLTRFYGRFWDPDYYRTYREAPGQPSGYMSVQAEVSRALASPADFLEVPRDAPDRLRKISGLHRDSLSDSRPAWVVCDGNYVSARWPGDVHTFARRFAELLD
ncbi:type 1 glutamine amidotransferase domain-containing protein [Pseudomonas sp.]|uniref:type 1 glutamine amidotransferase domain-containing protein n=1 Tax=Pseudomonas sp. TaxID=306 RepID=UPI002736430A|nr:type 1 glutamine amidotransferase domain-containing protein [Pseudomonas sp.]MDP3816365.1 type 1 glutamine amidotransferase domain-containing protein [Pseudomonas sp.]